MDIVSRKRRSEIMSHIRGRDTTPELRVRRALHKAGMRFRLHRADLPGRPDVVFSAATICIFVHGCFWHGCRRCVDGQRRVKSNTGYWTEKIKGNRSRDARNIRALRAKQWKVFLVWECQMATNEALGKFVAKIAASRQRRVRRSPQRAVT